MNDQEKQNLCVSFSGGLTSGYMTHQIMNNRHHWADVRVVFANTGQENVETLDFVDRCDRAFGWGVTWVEAEVTAERGKGTRHRIVTRETASLDGRPFEDAIKKYGIPNVSFPHCTRELKERPITSFLRSIGWAKPTTAIGIRMDEVDRMSASADKRRLIYPLIASKKWPSFPARLADVRAFWAKQPFTLGLEPYQGNCSWCWKKSLAKHRRLARETPEIYDFPRRMEAEHAYSGPGAGPRVFFRERRSTEDIFRLSAEEATNKSNGGCEDSCEPFQGELF